MLFGLGAVAAGTGAAVALRGEAAIPGLDVRRLRPVCATTFLGGLARLAAARSNGRPHPLFQALAILELTLPPVLLALRRRVAVQR